MSSRFFRVGVGVVVLYSRQVLLFERLDFPGGWQMIQGGVEDGEQPWAAALRETYEETGLQERQFTLLGEHPTWLGYELPAHLRRHQWSGQVQKWFAVRLNTGLEDIRLAVPGQKPEFSGYQLFSLAQVPSVAIYFKKNLVESVCAWLKSDIMLL